MLVITEKVYLIVALGTLRERPIRIDTRGEVKGIFTGTVYLSLQPKAILCRGYWMSLQFMQLQKRIS